MKISNWFESLQNDGNQLCSQFSRYIAPAYHHDKCERCVQMRLYSMNKTELTFSYVVFFVLLFLTLVIGFSGPPIEYTYVYDINKFDGKILEKGGPFSFVTPPLTRYNKQMWLYIALRTGNQDGKYRVSTSLIVYPQFAVIKDDWAGGTNTGYMSFDTDETYSENIHVNVTGIGLGTAAGDDQFAHSAIDRESNRFGKNSVFSSTVVEDITSKPRIRNLQCKMRTCEPFLIAHLSYIKYVRYKFEVRLSNFENFHHKYRVEQLTYVLRTYTPDFIQMEISFRIMYVIVTFFITLWFGNSLRKYPIVDWSYEQKWIMIILVALQFYNGPTYSMETILNHWFIGFVNNMFQSTFTAVMALHFLCLYHAFRQNERRFISFYMEKSAIVFIMWVLEIVLVYSTRTNEYLDLSYSFKLDYDLYPVITKWWRIFGILYLLYLLAVVFKAFTDLRMMPFFSKRLKIATVSIIFYATICVIIQQLDYGVTDFVEDDVISDTKKWPIHSSSVVFMGLYGAINFYTYLLAYIYSPALKPIFENVMMKDNPAFSMVNDSEDEDNHSFPPMRTRSSKSLLYVSEDEDELEHKPKDRASSLLLGRSNDDSD